MSIILFSLALAAATTTDQSYSKTVTVSYYYDEPFYPYGQIYLMCKSGSVTSKKMLTYLKNGYGTLTYWANEVPFYTDSRGYIFSKPNGKYFDYDEAAKKACFG